MTRKKRIDERFRRIQKALGYLISVEKDPNKLNELRRLYGVSKDLQHEVDIHIEEVINRYIRNGAFPEDQVGWLSDDFDAPDAGKDDPADDDKA